MTSVKGDGNGDGESGRGTGTVNSAGGLVESKARPGVRLVVSCDMFSICCCLSCGISLNGRFLLVPKSFCRPNDHGSLGSSCLLVQKSMYIVPSVVNLMAFLLISRPLQPTLPGA